jgi:hypothetical protein
MVEKGLKAPETPLIFAPFFIVFTALFSTVIVFIIAR